MQKNQTKASGLFDVSFSEIISLFKGRPNPEGKAKKILLIIGAILSPITAIGAIWGYVRSYNRHLILDDETPTLQNLRPISRVAMILGAIFIWVVLAVVLALVSALAGIFFSGGFSHTPIPFIVIGANVALTMIAFMFFKRWQERINASLAQESRFGTARWARVSDLADLVRQKGIYIGGAIYAYLKQGHFLLIGSSRSGKGTNIIIPSLLGLSGLDCSKFIIDIKGEISAITARFQKLIGQKVIVLAPWGSYAGKSSKYNPLDILINETNPDHLCDSATVIAEMLVPKSVGNDESYWSDRARTLITGLILFLVISEKKEPKNLTTLWKYLRLTEEDFTNLLADMSVSENNIVRATANEFSSLMAMSSKTFSSVLSTAQMNTDFLKSPALQASLESSDFDVNTLSNGKTTIYVVIPPEMLNSYNRWLRLVFATSLQAVVRNSNKRTLFILDECAALGYLEILPTALSTFAGYNVSMWPIFQDLAQMKAIYGEAFESMIANCAVRQVLGVVSNFTAEYFEKAMGTRTVVTYENGKANATQRPLITADEIIRGSATNIFSMIEQRPPTYFPKLPYYEMPTLFGKYDPNPYWEITKDQTNVIANQKNSGTPNEIDIQLSSEEV